MRSKDVPDGGESIAGDAPPKADALAFNIVRAEERANSVTTVLVQGRELSVLSD